MNPTLKQLSIIVVSWNVEKLLKQCIESIKKTVNDIIYEVIVIDNNSSDGTVEMIKREFPQIKLIENSKNIGFAAACNQGLQEASGEYLLLLNPDTILLENSVEKCILKMMKDETIGVLGPRILNPDLSLQLSCRRFPKLSSQLLILLKLHHLLPNLQIIRKYLMQDWPHNEEREVDQIMGAFFMTKRSVIEKTGALDEKFKLWFEEVDFCKRVKNSGYKVLFYPRAKIIHYKAASFNQVLALKAQLYFNRSLLHYFKKHKSGLEYLLILLIHPISLLLAFIVQILRFLGLFKPKRA